MAKIVKVERIPPELAALGFQQAMRDAPRTMFMRVVGMEKTGKTRWSIWDVPQPIGFIDIDKRAASTVAAAQEERRLMKLPPIQIYPIPLSIPTVETPEDQKLAVAEYLRFEAAWNGFLAMEGGGTLVVDTWSECWELIRMAEFGKLLNVKPHHYSPINARFNRLLDNVRDSNKNVILIQKLKERWEDEKPTGKYVPQGFSNTQFKVDTSVLLKYNKTKKEFAAEIEFCGLNSGLAGEELSGPVNTFAYLATQCYPGTELEEWGG